MSVMRKHLSLGIALALSASFLVAPANPLSTVAPATAAPAPAPTIGCNTAALQQHLNSILNQGGLSSFGGIVTNSLGKTYWDKSADRLLAPASVTKLLTAYSALHVLDRNARQKTTVSLAIDGSLVLHGTGDVTISRRKNGRTFYRNAPRLNDLANQVKRKLDRVPPALRPKRLIIDNSFYSGPTMAPGWYREDIGGGSITPMVPAMLDGGRVYDTGWYNSRTPNPSLQLGATLLQYLGLKDVKIEVGTPRLAPFTLGSIQSATLEDRVADMLLYSDNVLAESIGREVAAAKGQPASFRGAANAVLEEVRAHGISTKGAKLYDTSGLSNLNRLSARTVTETLRPRSAVEKRTVTDIIYRYLPIAGQTGTLRYRFGGPAAAGRGHVRAKTGSLTGVSTLAGVVYTRRSGTPLYFSFLANNSYGWGPNSTIDQLSTAVYLHGC
ncbi:MAG TPA: D-alanyl-D-alanine carboxypeptidase/D-alanyl-D-alanine-endopeptidase [Corynebacteriales bacterium]|nr:D-alanyl-D-alanine carboxypeptidase/D-alanyl-D-alanine-endopeptidase [Mycobacteriales bacterium]